MKEIINIDKTFIIYPGWAEGFIIAYISTQIEKGWSKKTLAFIGLK